MQEKNIICPTARFFGTVTSLMYVRTKKMYLQRTHKRTPATEWNSFTLLAHASSKKSIEIKSGAFLHIKSTEVTVYEHVQHSA
jgi:hypothetical protein